MDKNTKIMRKLRRYVWIPCVCIVILMLYLFKDNVFQYEKVNYIGNIKNDSLKYILQWNKRTNIPFIYLDSGQETFIKRDCEYYNCFITDNKYYLIDYTEYDVILFHGPEVIYMNKNQLPQRRYSSQKYVFASIESSDYYPVCDNQFDGFFNWTWTYKLNSDAIWGYMNIRDRNGTIIGPKTNMEWIESENMDPVDEKTKNKLRRKTKAVAWFVSNCDSRSKREVYAESLKQNLKKYNLDLDIFGKCGELKCCHSMCPPDEKKCYKMIENDYYFYLSFENSFSEDYVTEKLLTALQNYAVPIVYGSANYSRFLPDGAYLNAKEIASKLHPKELASKINKIIKNLDEYSDFFKWRNHYVYEDDNEYYCNFCKLLNDEELMNKTTIYHNFKEWWTPKNRC